MARRPGKAVRVAMPPIRSAFVAASIIASVCVNEAAAQLPEPRRAVNELLAADRAHAQAAHGLNVVDAIGGMIDDNGIRSAAGA